MKKLMLLAVVLAATLIAHAQVSIGVHGNVIGATMKNKQDNQSVDFENRFSWKFGLVAQVPISTNLNFMPQLNVLSKGGKFDETVSGEDDIGTPITINAKGDARLTYAELPLNVVYSSGSEEGGIFIGLGPSLGFGIGGQLEGTWTASALGQSYSRPIDADVKFDGKKDDELSADDEDVHYKRLDIGANVIAGYQFFNGLFVNAQYNHSFSNINPNSGAESKNRYFGVGIGYFFGRQASY